MAASIRVIDFRSDTVTKPTAEMRQAMFEAEVGDDVMREDPTVLKLEKQASEIFGMEAALYVPSGSMGNLICIMSHCWSRGQEILVGDQSHIYMFEQGSAAQFGGVHSRAVSTQPNGILDLEELESKIRKSDNCHLSKTGLICLENTHNVCGGAVLPVEYMEKVTNLGKSYNIPVHVDGARIWNAAVKLGMPVSKLLKNCSSVSACLSKGLGAPVGSLIGGSNEFIARALRIRKALGGGLRQAGVIAAAGLVALNKMFDRLYMDHEHAVTIAKAVNSSGLISVNLQSVQTNMVMMDFNKSLTAHEFCKRLSQATEKEKDEIKEHVIIKLEARSETRVRCVLHADVSPDDVLSAIKKIQYVIKEFKSA